MKPALNSQGLLAWNASPLRLYYCLPVTPYEAQALHARYDGLARFAFPMVPSSGLELSLCLFWDGTGQLASERKLFMSVSHLLNCELLKGKDWAFISGPRSKYAELGPASRPQHLLFSLPGTFPQLKYRLPPLSWPVSHYFYSTFNPIILFYFHSFTSIWNNHIMLFIFSTSI